MKQIYKKIYIIDVNVRKIRAMYLIYQIEFWIFLMVYCINENQSIKKFPERKRISAQSNQIKRFFKRNSKVNNYARKMKTEENFLDWNIIVPRKRNILLFTTKKNREFLIILKLRVKVGSCIYLYTKK